jgi:peptide subunit release factor 1 (eRF1)
MITREEIRELALFQARNGDGCALSFYFQPQTPHDKSHREEIILAKDLVREALQQAEKESKHPRVREDLKRILEIAGHMRGNQARAKAIFACGGQNFWREFDLPAQLPSTCLAVNQRFYLKPLAKLLGTQCTVGVILFDRHRARFFDLRLDELKEREGLFSPLSRRGRGDGYAGYDGGHSERRVHDEVLHHYKALTARLKEEYEKGLWQKFVLGGMDLNRKELEPHLPAALKSRLLGYFSADLVNATSDQVRAQAGHALEQCMSERRDSLVHEVLNQAKGNHRGVTGLRRVLRALEMGEVQTLVLEENYSAHAVECNFCGHLDSHMVNYCPVCGRATRELKDVCEALLPIAIRRDIEVFYVKEHPGLDRVGNIGALLRYRSEQNTAARLAS